MEDHRFSKAADANFRVFLTYLLQSARIIALKLRHMDQLDAMAISEGSIVDLAVKGGPLLGKNNVTEVVLRKIPMPDESVPWEKIIDFREDAVAEDLLKIRWGKAAQGILSLANRKVRLMKLEMDSPEREVHYILKLRNEFNSEM